MNKKTDFSKKKKRDNWKNTDSSRSFLNGLGVYVSQFMASSFYTRRIQLTSECWVRLNNAIKEKTLMSSNVKYFCYINRFSSRRWSRSKTTLAEAKRRTFHKTNES